MRRLFINNVEGMPIQSFKQLYMAVVEVQEVVVRGLSGKFAEFLCKMNICSAIKPKLFRNKAALVLTQLIK